MENVMDVRTRYLTKTLNKTNLNKNESNVYETIKGLSGSKVGILGLGRIGLAVGKRLMSFETQQISYHNRKENPEAKELGFNYVDFETLIKESDFLICTCALTNETKDLFNLKTFKKMKKNAIFINVARGAVVNQDDLCTALRENIILAAGKNYFINGCPILN